MPYNSGGSHDFLQERRVKAIVTGMMGTFPLGGVAWDYCQYAVGLERLGLEVYYLEDSGDETYVYVPSTRKFELNPDYGAAFIQESLASFSETLGKRWHFRSAEGRTYGMSEADFADVGREADVLLNVSGATLLRDAYRRCRRKVFIDTDPGWNHFRTLPLWDDKPLDERPLGFRSHDYFFTFAERIHERDCPLPHFGLEWHPTRHPVLADGWTSLGLGERYTTLMSWNTYRKPVEGAGVRYGAKEVEFEKVEGLPRRHPALGLEVAVNGDAPRERWQELGWSVVDGAVVSRTAQTYHDYVAGSRGELSVAKNIYVATRSGWFSGRSACYLAAGRPVILQDTGYSQFLPVGEGLLTFTNIDEASAALERVESNYALHARRAREIAEGYLGAERVLGDLLSVVGL
jgi:hypothetical protein